MFDCPACSSTTSQTKNRLRVCWDRDRFDDDDDDDDDDNDADDDGDHDEDHDDDGSSRKLASGSSLSFLSSVSLQQGVWGTGPQGGVGTLAGFSQPDSRAGRDHRGTVF